jgi:hypothetical protein
MGLKIKIPRRLWNAYKQPACKYTRSATRPKLKLRVPVHVTTHDTPAPESEGTARGPAHCKVKLFRFHHGGPQRQRIGRWQNEITYEQPCLQPTCPNCRRWHAHLLQQHQFPDSGRLGGRPAQEPISPAIDPRILDGTWQHLQAPPHSTVTVTSAGTWGRTPVLTPVVKTFPVHLYPVAPYQAHKYQILVPTPLISHTTTIPSVLSKWRTTLRQHYTARLIFTSHAGKETYRAMMKAKEKREKRREYDRARRVRMRELRTEGESAGRTVRCRYRARLVFATEHGRARFAGAVGGKR